MHILFVVIIVIIMVSKLYFLSLLLNKVVINIFDFLDDKLINIHADK